jgi:hypothetical protein
VGDDNASKAVLMQQRSRSGGRMYGRGVDNADGGGGTIPSAWSWDGSSCTLEDVRAEGSCRDDITARWKSVLTYAKVCQQLQHDGKADHGFE